MRNIAVTGYSGTGSSAIIDLLTESSNVNVVFGTKYEHSLLYFPGSIFDLKSKIVDNNDPLRSDEAIKEFRSKMNYLYYNNFGWFGTYRKLIGPDFLKICDAYLSEIKQGEFDSIWYNNYKKVVFSIPKVFLQLGAKVLMGRKVHKWGRKYIIKKAKIEYSFISEDSFNKATTKFLKSYFTLCGKSGKINVYDHLLWPSNSKHIGDFFEDDFRLIIVKRDPRDLFFINKYFWSKPPVSLPGTFPLEVKEFCTYYKGLMSEGDHNDSHILEIQFEDLVYHYEETKDRIADFVGFEKGEIGKKIGFNPEKSVKNTQVFNLKSEWAEELDYIEQELKDYLYEFPHRVETSFSEMFD